MPLFGKKKTDAEKKAEEAKKQEALAGASYPRQQGGAGSSSNPTYAPRYCVQQPLPGQEYVVPQGPPVGYPVAYPVAPPPYQQVQQTYVCQESNFAAGARFGVGHGSRPGIPPPPPGVMPNMAQIASSQGHHVVVSQNQQTIMGGTGDAGAVLW